MAQLPQVPVERGRGFTCQLLPEKRLLLAVLGEVQDRSKGLQQAVFLLASHSTRGIGGQTLAQAEGFEIKKPSRRRKSWRGFPSALFACQVGVTPGPGAEDRHDIVRDVLEKTNRAIREQEVGPARMQAPEMKEIAFVG